ncbi:MAG: DUF4292 domain-containing protein [Bacteroidales bacterium]|jgi:hypothetical protein
MSYNNQNILFKKKSSIGVFALLISIIFGFQSCKSLKQMSYEPKPIETTDNIVPDFIFPLIDDLSDRIPLINDFQCKFKSNISLKKTNQNYKINGLFQYDSNDKILITGTMLGVNLVTIYIDQNKLIIINKLNKTYQILEIDSIIFGENQTLNFELIKDLFFGRLTESYISINPEFKRLIGTNNITEIFRFTNKIEDGLQYIFEISDFQNIGNYNYYLNNISFKQFDKLNQMYKDFVTANYYSFYNLDYDLIIPNNINLHYNPLDLYANIFFSDFKKLDKPITFPSIPSNYKKVN